MIKINHELVDERETMNEFTAQLQYGSRIICRNGTAMRVKPMIGEDEENLGEQIGFAELDYKMVWDLRGVASKNSDWDMVELLQI